MLWIMIIVIFIFIEFIAFFGDTERRERERDARDWERILGRKYY